MRDFLKIGLSIMLLASAPIARADDVDPEGEDHWKTLTVTIEQLDRRKYSNYEPVQVDVDFYWLQDDVVSVDNLQPGSPIIRKYKMARRADARYCIKLSYGHQSHPRYEIKCGDVTSGAKSEAIQLKVINVNPMRITREDGSTYVVPDEDTEVNISGFGRWLVSNGRTSNSLIVPVGFMYQGDVEGETEDGIDRDKFTLDFR